MSRMRVTPLQPGLPRAARQPRPASRVTGFSQREWGHSARGDTVLRGDRSASPSLLLGRARPAKDYAMTLFPLLPPMMTAALCGGRHAASFGVIGAGRAGVDQRIRAGGRKEILSAPVVDGASPGWAGRAAQGSLR